MKKILNKANILGAVVSGDGLTYKRRPDLFVGDVKNGYNKGDLLDANAVAGMVTEAIQEHDADLTQLHDEISEFVNLRINELVDGAPETMDTLKEVADAIKYEIPNVVNEHEYVDLGLPSGTLWAKQNIGATSETDGGLYFAWGESRGYAVGDKEFNLGGYNFYDENAANLDFNLSKYNATDGKTILDYYDDAATIYMGDSWTMPTHAQIQELLNALNTTNQWVTNYKESGVNGLLITSVRNGNQLFLPAAGSAMNTNLLAQNEYCFYWSSEIVDNAFHTDAYNICADSNGVDANGESTRSAGRVVRGVTNELNVQPVLGELRQQINDAIESNELVIASALVDLDDRIRPFEGSISFELEEPEEEQFVNKTIIQNDNVLLLGSSSSIELDPINDEGSILIYADNRSETAAVKFSEDVVLNKVIPAVHGTGVSLILPKETNIHLTNTSSREVNRLTINGSEDGSPTQLAITPGDIQTNDDTTLSAESNLLLIGVRADLDIVVATIGFNNFEHDDNDERCRQLLIGASSEAESTSIDEIVVRGSTVMFDAGDRSTFDEDYASGTISYDGDLNGLAISSDTITLNCDNLVGGTKVRFITKRDLFDLQQAWIAQGNGDDFNPELNRGLFEGDILFIEGEGAFTCSKVGGLPFDAVWMFNDGNAYKAVLSGNDYQITNY